jgi:hypothetical protein
MQRNATRTGPGMALSPSAQRRTVLASLSNATAAWSWLIPSRPSAALNSSADNAAILQQPVSSRGEKGRDFGVPLALTEGVGQRAIRAEQRQALGTIRADRDEANRIGGQVRGRGGALRVHNPHIGPLALPVNGEMP